MADGHSAWEGSQKVKIGAAKRPFRVGGVAKVGEPTPQNGHSAWEGSQKLENRRRKTAIPRGRGRKGWRSDAATRPFRVGGVAKVGEPTPRHGHSAWEGSQKWENRRRKTAIPRGKGHNI